MISLEKFNRSNGSALDGYFEGSKQSIDWHLVDHDYGEYAADLLRSVDTILFGRGTYELMVNTGQLQKRIPMIPS